MNNETTTPLDRLAVDLSLLVVRVIAGTVFAAHGAQKLLGVWGGPGLAKSIEMLEVGPLGYLVVIGEFFGGLGLILGFLTRFSAASLILIMIGAIVRVHGQHGFFLQNQGFEYNLALIGLLLPTLLCGPGRFSIGRILPLPKSAQSGRPVAVLE
jgi:putative oxidoreductase